MTATRGSSATVTDLATTDFRRGLAGALAADRLPRARTARVLTPADDRLRLKREAR